MAYEPKIYGPFVADDFTEQRPFREMFDMLERDVAEMSTPVVWQVRTPPNSWRETSRDRAMELLSSRPRVQVRFVPLTEVKG